MAARLRWLMLGLGLAAAGALGLAEPGPLARPVAPRPAAGHVSGSGFLVAPGLLVTNAHLLLRCRALGQPLQVAGPGRWRLLAEDAGTDLALLAGPAEAGTGLPLGDAAGLPRGAPVLALGYPAAEPWPGGRLQPVAGRLRGVALTVHDPATGQAVSFRMTDRQGRMVEPRWEDGLRYFGAAQAERLRWRLEIAAGTEGGSSGGPVLDAAGRVVGVVYAGGEGVTAAVPLADLRDFLGRAGIRLPPRPGATRAAAPDWTRIGGEAERSLRRLGC